MNYVNLHFNGNLNTTLKVMIKLSFFHNKTLQKNEQKNFTLANMNMNEYEFNFLEKFNKKAEQGES